MRLAEESADIIAFDICQDVKSVVYPLSTKDDLDETVAEVEKLDRRIVAAEADVRDLASVQAVVDRGVSELGRLDVVSANAGIVSMAPNAWTLCEGRVGRHDRHQPLGRVEDVSRGDPGDDRGGQRRLDHITSSTAGIRGMAGIAHYASSKHGVVGLARTLAHELAPYHIRVNTVHPTAVTTPMVVNEATQTWLEENEGAEINMENLLPVQMIEAVDISNAIVWLASDHARYITGVALPIDAGFTQK